MEKLTGIIIRATDYGEKDKILSIAAFGRGLVAVKAKGVRGGAAKLKCYAAVLTLGEFYITPTKSGAVLSGADCQESFYSCWSDGCRYGAAMLCLELFEKVAREQDEADNELILLLRELKEINYSSGLPLLYALRFMINVAHGLGVDFSGIEGYDAAAYKLIGKIQNDADLSKEQESQSTVLSAVKYVGLFIKGAININLKTITQVLKA